MWLSLGGCDIGQDNEDPAVKSQELRTKAVEYINGHDYLHAEQLFSEILPLDQQLQQWDRLAEDRSTAAKVEASLGLFSSAIENNTEAWKYYRQVGDHAAEVRSMNAVGNLSIGLGDFEKGINILSDALEVSKLSSNNEPDPETSMNLGNAFFWSGQYENALDQFDVSTGDLQQTKILPCHRKSAVACRLYIRQAWKKRRGTGSVCDRTRILSAPCPTSS